MKKGISGEGAMAGDEVGCVCVSVCEEESKRVRSYSTTSLNLNLLHNSHSFIFARKYFLKRRCLCVSFKTISAAEKAPDDG